jgi:hypothetical protein
MVPDWSGTGEATTLRINMGRSSSEHFPGELWSLCRRLEEGSHLPEVQAEIREAIGDGRIRAQPSSDDAGRVRLVPTAADGTPARQPSRSVATRRIPLPMEPGAASIPDA